MGSPHNGRVWLSLLKVERRKEAGLSNEHERGGNLTERRKEAES